MPYRPYLYVALFPSKASGNDYENRHVVIHHAHLRWPHENLSRASDSGSQRWVELPVPQAIGSKPLLQRPPTFGQWCIIHDKWWMEIPCTVKSRLPFLHVYMYKHNRHILYIFIYIYIFMTQVIFIYTCHLWCERFIVRCFLDQLFGPTSAPRSSRTILKPSMSSTWLNPKGWAMDI